MKGLLRRIRGGLGLGITWGAVGFAFGMGIELIHNIWPNPLGGAVDIWPMVLAVPGFFGGVSFSTVLAIAGRNRRFAELSLPKFAFWGGLGGLAVSFGPAVMSLFGLAPPNAPIAEITAWLAGPCVLGRAAAASGSLALARVAENRAYITATDGLEDVGLTEEESRELLGEG